jgi:hAT family C-terminal dimerisation region
MLHSIEMGWFVLNKYYGLSDGSPIYAAATLLHPSRRLRYLNKNWKPEWRIKAVEATSKLWREKYAILSCEAVSEPASEYIFREKTILDELDDDLDVLDDVEYSNTSDDFMRFIEDNPVSTGRDSQGQSIRPLVWWCHSDRRERYPRLSQMAIDVFSVAPFSDEPERVFSGARRTVSWDRHSLSAATIEVVECLGHWIKQGLQWITVRGEDRTSSESFSSVISS